MPLLLFSGFVFGKWWGILIVLTSTTLGAALLYLLVGFFLRDALKEKLTPKFSKLREFFNKNDIIYFMCFRFVGGTPYWGGLGTIVGALFGVGVIAYM